jgi:hypothetical protein
MPICQGVKPTPGKGFTGVAPFRKLLSGTVGEITLPCRESQRRHRLRNSHWEGVPRRSNRRLIARRRQGVAADGKSQGLESLMDLQ